MPSFAELIAQFLPEKPFSPPREWYQGRTVYGGLTAALAVQQCLVNGGTDLPALKSAHISFVGPASGDLVFTPTLLRRGKSVTSVNVDCQCGADIVLRAALTFAQARTSTVAHDFSSPPTVKSPSACPPLHAEDLGVAPAFIANFEMRSAGGSLPLSAAREPELLFWMRHRDAQGVDPAVALVALADAMPPAAMASFTAPAPVSSMTWSVELPRPPASGDWFLMRAFSRQASNGYSIEDLEIWDEDGHSVLCSRQCVAIFT